MERREPFKPLVIIAMFFAALVAASFVSPKMGALLGFVFSVGAIPYALTFPCVDIICETRGRLRAFRVVIAGLVAHLFAIGFMMLAVAIPPGNVWIQPAGVDPTSLSSYPVINRHLLFDMLFPLATTWKFVGAGLVAYLLTQSVNVLLFDAIRRIHKGRRLWIRCVVSTGICQAVDTAIFVPLAFAEMVSDQDLWVILGSQFGIKLAVAILVVPLVYMGVWWIGRPSVEEPSSAETGGGGTDSSVGASRPDVFDKEGETGPISASDGA